MARIFRRFLGTRRALLADARAAELRGDLAHAAALFAQSGRPDEAARVMVLRGDAEAESAARLRHYVQAAAVAPEGSGVHIHAQRRRWSTVLSMANDAPMTSALRAELSRAASELDALGDHTQAAEAFARVGDIERQAHALAHAGDIDALDALLSAELKRDRDATSLRRAHDDIALLLASGRRREAAAIGRASTEEALREKARAIESRRLAQSIVHATVRGKAMDIALGNEVVIGRAPDPQGSPGAATLIVGSPAVSRRHVLIARKNGEPVVRDLGSRNATVLRGLALGGEAPVRDGLELRLGGEVPLVVMPTDDLAGAVAIEVGGMRYIAPLGPAVLGVGRWRLERGDDGWIELVTDDSPPAFAGSLRLVARVTLLSGDALAEDRGQRPVLEVH
jgi:hypothetical protein